MYTNCRWYNASDKLVVSTWRRVCLWMSVLHVFRNTFVGTVPRGVLQQLSLAQCLRQNTAQHKKHTKGIIRHRAFSVSEDCPMHKWVPGSPGLVDYRETPPRSCVVCMACVTVIGNHKKTLGHHRKLISNTYEHHKRLERKTLENNQKIIELRRIV